MKRRDFVQLGSMLAATPNLLYPENIFEKRTDNPKPQVDFLHDGLQLSPKEYAELLMKLADEGKIKPDFYSNGGVVEELENKFAKLMGKESAVFMPTGTLANHLALRKLAGYNHRAIVQEQSHIYNDTGDAAQILSGLNLIPLGLDKVEFTLEEVEKVVAKTKLGRVESPIGVIAIETPVRRQQDRMVSYESLKTMTDFAKNNNIKTHLDGARLFVQSVHTNTDPAKYGGLFDTVFTSMWKCFNASSGAILAGPKSFTEKLFHDRRMFGGGLPAAWVFAAVALHYADGFVNEYKKAWSTAEKLFAELGRNDHFKLESFENGSHIVRLNLLSANPDKFRESLAKRNIEVAKAAGSVFSLKVNPSLNRTSYQELTAGFLESLKEALV